MPSNTEITVAQLSRIIGLPDAPTIIDVRVPQDYEADPLLLPGSVRKVSTEAAKWAAEFKNRNVVVLCQKGLKLSQGAVAMLRHEGIAAENLEGGFEAWRRAGGLLIDPAKIPPRDARERTVWVTRARPKIDRIACPWLVRRFIDPLAVFLFVAPSEVGAVAERFAATPFDVDGTFWSHRGDRCTFDTMLEEFGLQSPALERLAAIIRGADTAQMDLTPQSAGLLAASLGFSRMYRDDLEQLNASMSLYDAFYRWCRDAVAETHDWPAPDRR